LEFETKFKRSWCGSDNFWWNRRRKF